MQDLIGMSHPFLASLPLTDQILGQDDYFVTHLSLSRQDANELHVRYYKDYGLAIAGLVLHHKIDPLEFNREVDDALPLDNIITADPQLRNLLADIDRTKVKPWLFTNAYINHAQRVIRLLGVGDMFEGITFCDYGKWPFVCKPDQEMFRHAEEEAGASSVENCYFVGKLTPFHISMEDVSHISTSPRSSAPFLQDVKVILLNRRLRSQLPACTQSRLDDGPYPRAGRPRTN